MSPNIEPRKKKENEDKLHRLDVCLVKVASFSHRPWSQQVEEAVSDLSMDMGYGEKLQLAVIAEGGKRHLVSPHLADLPDRTGQARTG